MPAVTTGVPAGTVAVPFPLALIHRVVSLSVQVTATVLFVVPDPDDDKVIVAVLFSILASSAAKRVTVWYSFQLVLSNVRIAGFGFCTVTLVSPAVLEIETVLVAPGPAVSFTPKVAVLPSVIVRVGVVVAIWMLDAKFAVIVIFP